MAVHHALVPKEIIAPYLGQQHLRVKTRPGLERKVWSSSNSRAVSSETGRQPHLHGLRVQGQIPVAEKGARC